MQYDQTNSEQAKQAEQAEQATQDEQAEQTTVPTQQTMTGPSALVGPHPADSFTTARTRSQCVDRQATVHTLAGKEIETTVPIGIYHWEMLENYLVELLARNFDLDTFVCELMLTAEDTRSPLSGPIHALGEQGVSIGHP